MKTKAFEKNCPDGYKQVFHLDATSKKLGILFNLVAFAIMAVVMLIAIIPLVLAPALSFGGSVAVFYGASGVFLLSMVLYMVLHELVHGAAYKALTGEKLTFGIRWSCAFCGVPHIYTYRRTALIAVASPLVFFTILLLPLTAVLYFVHPLFYLYAALLLGLHLGGCAGDLYVIGLLLFRYRDDRVLMRDTGPEQFFYLPPTADEN